MTNKELYDDAKRRYNNACGDISYCKNQISALKEDRQRTVNEINQLEANIKKVKKAIEQVEQMLNKESELNSDQQKIRNKIDDAAVNFSSMVSSSNVTNKNLSDVYGEETGQIKQKIENAMNIIRTKANEMKQRLEELKNKVRTAKQNLENIDHQIRSKESDLSAYQSRKNNASIDMTYYYRKMQEEGIFD